MARILVTDGMDYNAAQKLKNMEHELTEEYFEPEELKEEVKKYDGIMVDNIDVSYANENGIKVFNTPNSSSASVAKLAIAHMFVLARLSQFLI